MRTIVSLSVSLAILIALILIIRSGREEVAPKRERTLEDLIAALPPAKRKAEPAPEEKPAPAREPRAPEGTNTETSPAGEELSPFVVLEFRARILAGGEPVEGASVRAERLVAGISAGPFDTMAYGPGSDAAGMVTGFASHHQDWPDDTLYGIAAYHPERGSAYREIALGELKTLAPGDLVLELERGATIEGRVVDEKGSPVPRARVELFSQWPERGVCMSGLDVRTDPDGRFTLSGIRFENVPTSLRVVYEEPSEARYARAFEEGAKTPTRILCETRKRIPPDLQSEETISMGEIELSLDLTSLEPQPSTP